MKIIMSSEPKARDRCGADITKQKGNQEVWYLLYLWPYIGKYWQITNHRPCLFLRILWYRKCGVMYDDHYKDLYRRSITNCIEHKPCHLFINSEWKSSKHSVYLQISREIQTVYIHMLSEKRNKRKSIRRNTPKIRTRIGTSFLL